MEAVEHVCEQCEKPFLVKRTTSFKRKYCGNRCAVNAKRVDRESFFFTSGNKKEAKFLFQMKSKFN